jgi:copper chaperone CopZ
VSRADVSFRTKEAVVAFDPAQVSVERMLQAVRQIGFRASMKGTPEK